MSSTILYKFKSGTTFEALPLPGTAAKLLDVKKAIVKQKKLDQGSSMDFDISVQDATSNEMYTDDSKILPRGTRIVVQRRAAPRGQGILAQIARAEHGLQTTTTTITTSGYHHQHNADFYTIDGSQQQQQQDEDEFVSAEERELAALRAATDSATMAGIPSRSHFRPTHALAGSGPPPPRQHHHHHQQRYRPNADPELREQEQAAQPKKRATGIPRTFLSLSGLQSGEGGTEGALIQPNTIGFEELVQRAGGQSEIATGTKRDLDYAIKLTATTIPEYLQCAICHGVVRDAMMLPWDPEGRTTCESCIRNALTESGFVCPLTQQEGVSPDDLLPNHALRKAAEQFVKEVWEKVTEIDQQANVDETIQDDDETGTDTKMLEDGTTDKGVILTRRASTTKKEDDPFGGGGTFVFGGDVFATSSPKQEEKTEPDDNKATPVVKSEETTTKTEAVVNKEEPTLVKSEPVDTTSGLAAPVKPETPDSTTPQEMTRVKKDTHPTPEKTSSASSQRDGGRRRGPPVGYTMGPAGGMATEEHPAREIVRREDSPYQDRRYREDDRRDERRREERRSEERTLRGDDDKNPEDDRRRDDRHEERRRSNDDDRQQEDRRNRSDHRREEERRRSEDHSPRDYDRRSAPRDDRSGNGHRDEYRRDEHRDRRKRSRSPSEKSDDRRHREGRRGGGRGRGDWDDRGGRWDDSRGRGGRGGRGRDDRRGGGGRFRGGRGGGYRGRR